MIRFVDLRNARISGYRFAFWDTVRDRFCEFSNEQAWETLEEFRADLRGHIFDQETFEPKFLRFKRLMPKWVFEKVEDEDGI